VDLLALRERHRGAARRTVRCGDPRARGRHRVLIGHGPDRTLEYRPRKKLD
jgi:hypothetical protein